MADQTAPRHDERQTGDILAVPLAAVKVYAGSIVTYNAAGYADVGDASEALAGVAIETVDNAAGEAGDKSVRVYRNGIFKFNASGLTVADNGKAVQIGSDDNTVTIGTAGAGKVQIGRIARVISATECLVQLDVLGNTLLA